MKSVLITGGAGFIGSHLALALTEQRVNVRVLDNLSSPSGLAAIENSKEIEILEGDVRDSATCRKALRGIDVVFHMAALVSVPQSVADPGLSNSVNIDGTLNLLIACRDMKTRRFVFSSSAAVYGDCGPGAVTERQLPMPTSPYGIQKLTGEHYARMFFDIDELETVSLRYFNVYGPRQDPKSQYAAVIPKFMSDFLEDRSPTIFGTGEQTRNFLSVRDIVAANTLAASTENKSAIGGVFNIAGDGAISLNQLVQTIQHITGKGIEARYAAARPGDILHSNADASSAKHCLGFVQNVPLEAGLREMLPDRRLELIGAA